MPPVPAPTSSTRSRRPAGNASTAPHPLPHQTVEDQRPGRVAVQVLGADPLLREQQPQGVHLARQHPGQLTAAAAQQRQLHLATRETLQQLPQPGRVIDGLQRPHYPPAGSLRLQHPVAGQDLQQSAHQPAVRRHDPQATPQRVPVDDLSHCRRPTQPRQCLDDVVPAQFLQRAQQLAVRRPQAGFFHEPAGQRLYRRRNRGRARQEIGTLDLPGPRPLPPRDLVEPVVDRCPCRPATPAAWPA